jgi:HlyD family secretion protein
MKDGTQIFRPEALERLASPEQLDELMVVTDSKAWVALSAVGFILAVTLVWSIFGAIPTSIQGSGILLRRGGVYDIQAAAPGQVLSMLAAEDSVVELGQIIAYIAQADLVTQIDIARQDLAVLQARRQREAGVQGQSLHLTLSVLEQDSVRIAGEIVALQAQTEWLRARLTDTEYAREQGLVTGEAVESVRRQLSAAESQLSSARGQLTGIENRRIQARHDHDTRIETVEQQIRSDQATLQLLTGQLTQANEVRSPYRGRVTEVMVDEGQLVAAGTPVASVELLDEALQAVIFVPKVGAKARRGLTAHVQPLTVNWQEHGYMVGTVDFVSMGPVTIQRMNRVLKNDVLSQSLVAAGDPYLLEITLNPADTPTGFEWTSGRGPSAEEATIHGGLLCSASVIVDSQRPITLVIPALRKFFGL